MKRTEKIHRMILHIDRGNEQRLKIRCFHANAFEVFDLSAEGLLLIPFLVLFMA